MSMTEVVVASGLDLLPTTGDRSAWTERESALMDSLGLRGTKKQQRGGQWVEVQFEAPRPVVEQFLTMARRTGLDPFARQIYCIERGGKWGIQASIDGFRLVAERTGQYRGQTPAQWCGQDGQWVEVWLHNDPPAAARIGIYRDGFAEPLWAVATYDGYCPRNRTGDLDPKNQWLTNPANQLSKCAEMLGLRKAFPQDLSGIYGTEEMDQATRTAPEPARRPDAAQPALADGADAPRVQAAVAAPADPEAEARWLQWKEAIDAAKDRRELGALWEQARAIANLPIPGDPQGRKVGDYFAHVGKTLPDEVDQQTGEVDPTTSEAGDPVTAWATREVPKDEPVDAVIVDDEAPF